MALTRAAATQTVNSQTGATMTSASFTPANNSLLVVVYSKIGHGTNGYTGTCSGGGWTWTKRVEGAYSHRTGWTSGGDYYVYGAIWTAPVSTGASMTITVGDGNSSGDQAHLIHAYTYTDYDTSSPIGQTFVQQDNTWTGSVTVNFSGAPASTSECLAVRNRVDNGGYNCNSVAGGSWTNAHYTFNGGGYNDLTTMYRSGSTSTAIEYSDYDIDPGPNCLATHIMGIEIKQSGGGGGGDTIDLNSGLDHIQCGSPMGKKTNGILHPIRHGIVGWRKGLILPSRRIIKPRRAA